MYNQLSPSECCDVSKVGCARELTVKEKLLDKRNRYTESVFTGSYTKRIQSYWDEDPKAYPYEIQEEMRRLQDSYMAKICNDSLTGPRTASESKTKPTQSQNLILLLCN